MRNAEFVGQVGNLRRVGNPPACAGWQPARRIPSCPTILAFAVFASISAAQQAPHAGYVYPAGGQRGTTVDVRVGGQFLNGVSKAYVSGKRVEAKIIEYMRPVAGAEAQKLRDEMQKLNQKRSASGNAALTAVERARMLEIRDKLEEVQRRPSVPAIAEIVNVRVAIAPDAALGSRQLRLETNGGLTNPIVFRVGELPEIARKPARVGPAYNVFNGSTPQIRQVARPPELPTAITLPAVVNGQMMPGVSDQYRFQAKKGQRIVIAADARELIPYVSDAVPGWFQAVVTLRDTQGKELASADHYRFHPDPLLAYEIPADGDYIAEIHDSIFRGREDFIYRVTMGELPVIAGIFPLGAKAGARVTLEAHGLNLPSARITENFKGKPKGVYPVSLRQDDLTSNAVPFVLDSLRETTAKPGIGRREKAQRVKLPSIVNGRIAQPGEVQFFRIDGHTGEEIVAEVTARRLGSPLDSVLRLTDAKGKELAFNDDYEDKGAGLLTHQADSYLSCRLPAKGPYYLQLADAQHKSGPEYGYRLRISHPRPDFELLVAPASLNLRAGSTVPVTVQAVRKDGFAGQISLKLKDAPADFTISGAAIPSGQDKVRITLSVPRTPVGLPLAVQLIGHASIEGHEVTRTAVPAEDMEQAFAYHHLVAEDAWMVRVIGTGAGGLPWRAIEKPVKLPAGGATPIELFVPPRFQSGVRLALNEPPEGISIQSITEKPNGVSVVFKVQADKAKPGLKGNLIVDAFREVQLPANAKNQPRRRQAMGTLPAIPFEVVEAPARK
ncbi:MAG TPA: hypothetical protein VLX58_12715 [Bryobacteraceae bacterium]|nr:hypothetical protein [Bryobacteraceae bacterium]